MFDSLQAMSLLTIMEIIGPILLLAVLIYGTVQWSPTARANTGRPRSLHARVLSGGRQSGEAGRSRQGVGGEIDYQPTAAPAIGRRSRIVLLVQQRPRRHPPFADHLSDRRNTYGTICQ